jgi:AraC family transcriptional regulator, regulatory protein of adaptative response / DNA-3-methyladenine glycosylase II
MPSTTTLSNAEPAQVASLANLANLTHGAYAAIVARDARFDGRLFVGVTSTGIYCRPVCRVRTPLQRNCRFFHNAAGAELAGFRPCLRCRPELAPGLSLVDSSQVLAHHAARMIDQAVHDGQDLYLPTTAARLGVSDRHLRRVFQQTHGVSPLDYLSTRRLLLAKQLLTDTALPVTQIAHASGFASLRRFNAAFVQRYRLSPSALRKQSPAERPADQGAVTVRLGYRPPYDVAGVLRFFQDRAVPGVEWVEGLTLRRTLAWAHAGQRLTGWLAASFVPERHELHVNVSQSLVPVLGAVLQRLRQGLDLDADPALIDPVLAALPVPPRAGVRVPNGVDGFEIAVRVILGQQVTVAAARTLTRRLVEALGEPVITPFAELTRLFPSAQAIAEAEAELIGKLGIVRQRVRALQGLAAAVHAGHIALHRGAPLAATLDALRALPGIGEWTVQLIAMRALAWPDAFPATDIGLLNALGTRDVKAVEVLAEAWRPWRAYAVMRLWQTLET